jgi:DnaJ-class molecular chaperone
MAMKDPYSVLGVEKSVSADEIKKSYRTLAKELHPDLNPGNKVVEQRFKEVSAAYHLLSDPKTRAKFDRGEIQADGSAGYENAYHRASGQAGAGRFDFNFNRDSGNIDDIFSDLFGRNPAQGGRPRSQSRKGQDVTYTIHVSFVDAAKGTAHRIKLFDKKMLDAKVPAGTADGQILRLKGQGMHGIGGGAAGDALVTIRVDPHPIFTLEGRDINVTLPITLDEAVLGAKITVPTIDGKVSVSVPSGTSSGAKLRLKGKGIVGKSNTVGDQFVMLKVVLPDDPDEELTKFAKKWAKGDGDEIRRKAGMP